MAKMILICGKICSGKTGYAKSLMKNDAAVLLSSDEITLALFGSNGGQEHGAVVEKLQKYLYKKSLEIVEAGMNVILDWGFWTQKDRHEANTFFSKNNIAFEWHYIDSSDDILQKNLRKRNHDIEEGGAEAYYFPENIVIGFWEMFEIPQKNEIDVWVDNCIV
jgi:Predicted kinase